MFRSFYERRAREVTLPDMRRLVHRRSDLHGQIRSLRSELESLTDLSSNVGVVSKILGSQILIKTNYDGRYLVASEGVEMSLLRPGTRVALRPDTYAIHRILPPAVDPLVQLMLVDQTAIASNDDSDKKKFDTQNHSEKKCYSKRSSEDKKSHQYRSYRSYIESKKNSEMKEGKVSVDSKTILSAAENNISSDKDSKEATEVSQATLRSQLYEEIGGLEKEKMEIREAIELPITHPELFENLGIAQPKGVLLYGPPGTGKTLLARAVAKKAKCAFIRVSGSELVQKYIGEGSRLVRDLFQMARQHAPSVIFMDEIDSIGQARCDRGGDSEVQRTMLELLNQLDGFEPTNRVKIIMATNRIDILDPALLRPGRIDRKIEFPNPTIEARVEILKIHSKKMNLGRSIDLRAIATKTVGASGAEVKAVCTEAGMFAVRERRVHVTQEDFEMAVAKVMTRSFGAGEDLKHHLK